MTILTIAASGQISLLEDVLSHLGVHPGEQVTVDKLSGGRIEIKAARPSGQISDVFNFLKREGSPSLSIEEITQITTDAWAGKR